jgi:hypothetical protein
MKNVGSPRRLKSRWGLVKSSWCNINRGPRSHANRFGPFIFSVQRDTRPFVNIWSRVPRFRENHRQCQCQLCSYHWLVNRRDEVGDCAAPEIYLIWRWIIPGHLIAGWYHLVRPLTRAALYPWNVLQASRSEEASSGGPKTKLTPLGRIFGRSPLRLNDRLYTRAPLVDHDRLPKTDTYRHLNIQSPHLAMASIGFESETKQPQSENQL